MKNQRIIQLVIVFSCLSIVVSLVSHTALTSLKAEQARQQESTTKSLSTQASLGVVEYKDGDQINLQYHSAEGQLNTVTLINVDELGPYGDQRAVIIIREYSKVHTLTGVIVVHDNAGHLPEPSVGVDYSSIEFWQIGDEKEWTNNDIEIISPEILVSDIAETIKDVFPHLTVRYAYYGVEFLAQ